MVDLRGEARRPFSPVGARVVDVDVEAVLVRGVARAERASVMPAEVADAQPWRQWMSDGVFAHDA